MEGIKELVKPPVEAHKFHPSPEDCLVEYEDYVERRMFHKQLFKDWERGAISKLRQIQPKSLQSTSDEEALRFLYQANWSPQKAVEALELHKDWKEDWPEYERICPLIQEVLHSGGLYLHGRDKLFRPVLVVRPSKLASFSYQQILTSSYFLLELITHEMILPGHIENWVILIDLKGSPRIPTKVLIKLVRDFTAHYPCRLAAGFVLNAEPTTRLLLSYLPKITAEKIRFDGVLDLISEAQVETKYGGACENLRCFWPPSVPNNKMLTANSSECLKGLSPLELSYSGSSFISDDIWDGVEFGKCSFGENKTVDCSCVGMCLIF